MKKNQLWIIGFVSLAIGLVAITNGQVDHPFAAKADADVLRIYNWEDYIYEAESAEDEPSIVDQFIDYMDGKGRTIEVVYDTFATNEDMYNIIKSGKETYDLIAPSDYMIQRMIRENMLTKFTYDTGTDTYTNIPNYSTYASHYLQDIFAESGWSEYSVGYMWGTMGLIYNPETVAHADTYTWDVLWDAAYKNKISIKDSMRDAYLVAIMHVYKDELNTLATSHQASTITDAAYNAALVDIINRADADTIALVGEALKTLKGNIYGLEVDSGKNDIVTGKIAMNTAWSGDAVYSMDTAEEEDGVELFYSIPEEGSNIWFDGWVMPTGANVSLAEEFLDFISNPDIAALNMEYIGYTSFIAGDSILDLVNEWYGADDSASETFDVDLSYFFDGTISNEKSAVITTDTLGRQFSAQYPAYEDILRCGVMQDFGEANDDVIRMWAAFKATIVPPWVYIASGVIVIGGIAYGVYYFLNNKKSKRQKRRVARTAK